MMLNKFFKHFNTVIHHKYLVMIHCFKCGLYRQGIMHDMSKFSPVEFFAGVKYYQGFRSPNAAQKEKYGYSTAWLHHKGRNKHHFEYWIDFGMGPEYKLIGNPMPRKYVVEMFCDRIAASKVYLGKNYKDVSPLEYYEKGKHYYVMHEETAALLEKLLCMLAQKGEKETFSYIKNNII